MDDKPLWLLIEIPTKKKIVGQCSCYFWGQFLTYGNKKIDFFGKKNFLV